MDYFGITITLMLSWWIIFYIILPIGIKVPDNVDKGLATSAPEHPNIMTKVIQTTLLSIVFTILFQYTLKELILTNISL